MGIIEKLHYYPPEDVKFLSENSAVESKKFSIALLKLRMDRMSDADMLRANKTILCLQSGLPYDYKKS